MVGDWGIDQLLLHNFSIIGLVGWYLHRWGVSHERHVAIPQVHGQSQAGMSNMSMVQEPTKHLHCANILFMICEISLGPLLVERQYVLPLISVQPDAFVKTIIKLQCVARGE